MEKDQRFEQFYNEYYMKVFRYVWKKIRQSDDAEDLTQNAFLYCYQHFEEFDESRASFGTWIYLIINSRIKNYYRDKHSNVNIDDCIEFLPSDGNLDTAIELDDMRAQLIDALDRCSHTQKQIVILKYFHNQSAREIAGKVGLTEGNVRTQLSRALSRMEQYLSTAERK